MRADEFSRHRSILLARWRGAAVANEAEIVEPRDASASPALVPLDEADLFAAFDTELLNSVAQPMADMLRRILAAPRAAFLHEGNAKQREDLLCALDQVEDVLDALLFAGTSVSDGGVQERS